MPLSTAGPGSPDVPDGIRRGAAAPQDRPRRARSAVRGGRGPGGSCGSSAAPVETGADAVPRARRRGRARWQRAEDAPGRRGRAAIVRRWPQRIPTPSAGGASPRRCVPPAAASPSSPPRPRAGATATPTIRTAPTAASSTSPASPSRTPCWCSTPPAAACCSAGRPTPEGELWEGVRLGTAAAPAALGVDEACDIALLDERLPALLAGQPALWWPFGGDDGAIEARLHAGSPRCARGRRRRPARPRCCATWARRWPSCASSRTTPSRTRCAAPPPSRPARTCGRCASAPRGCAPTRRAACASTRSRPSCCTSSAATAPPGRPIRRSSPPAPTPACCTTRRAARCCAPASCAWSTPAARSTATPATSRAPSPPTGASAPSSARSTTWCSPRSEAAVDADASRRAPPGRPLGGGARAVAGAARPRPARPRGARRRRRGGRARRLPAVLHARHRPLARPRRARRGRVPRARRGARRAARPGRRPHAAPALARAAARAWC